jgi:hypothetical protein
MTSPASSTAAIKRRMAAVAVIVILLSPVIIYIWKFGPNIGAEHSRWAEMGSAMSGIYAPILAVFTLLVIMLQVQLQSSMNRHTFDHKFVEDARVDIHFYLEQLAREISRELDDGSTFKSRIVEVFGYCTVDEMKLPASIDVAKSLNRKNHSLVAMWTAYYSILAGLKANNYYPYSNGFGSAKQKAIALLSYECCAALDNLTHSVSDGRLNLQYEFSRSFPETNTAA